ncbi:MAG: dTDP-glucose 4,6-dehydratase [Planctomycetota bacterium]
MKTYIVTGGCGFIGSCFIRGLINAGDVRVVNLDKLTYAGNPDNIPDRPEDRYELVRGCVTDGQLVRRTLERVQPDALIHFAAESHVDRSIDGPLTCDHANVTGTVTLLEQTRQWYRAASRRNDDFRFVHISTDEVYGSMGGDEQATEFSPYRPSSPYAASKASADMWVRAYHETYGLPTIIANATNNYGPFQFPEKLIPLMLLNAIESKPLPIYGDGKQVRDWLFVEDHCDAIVDLLARGRAGQKYNVGAGDCKTNLEVVHTICQIIDERLGRGDADSSLRLIRFVDDRPGHDRRYAIDTQKIQSEIGWSPRVSFADGIRRTVDWFLENKEWVRGGKSGDCARKRLGTLD